MEQLEYFQLHEARPRMAKSYVRSEILHSFKFIITVVIFTLNLNCYYCQELDPGQMFGEGPDIHLLSDQQPQDQTIEAMLYNWSPMSDKTAWFTDDSSCSTGISIVLKRIVWKLYNHVNKLQPDELDDEFIYQSTITYQDYSSMMKYLHENQLNCAGLHRLDSLLSRFISRADVTRPTQNNFFSTLFSNSFYIKDLHTNSDSIVQAIKSWPHSYLVMILTSVALTTWFLRHVGHFGEWSSNLLGILIPGFIQFYMQQHSLSVNNFQERIERCENPSYLNRVLYYLNYDHNNCYSLRNDFSPDTSPHLFVSNVAKIYIQYLSELIFEPIKTFATKIGEASQSYLDSYTGLDRIVTAPIFLFAIYILAPILFGFVFIHAAKYFFSGSSRTNAKQITNQKRKQIDNGKNSSSQKKVKNK